MINMFKESLKLVLAHEGGFVDHPRDPGGATMKGVTIAVYRRAFGVNKTKGDLRNITDKELQEIYRMGYWNKCRCDELPTGIDYVVFDAAVNSGPWRSVRWLQGAVFASQDGIIGPNTIRAANNIACPVTVINDMCDARLNFLIDLSTWNTFGKGWTRRIEGVREAALKM